MDGCVIEQSMMRVCPRCELTKHVSLFAHDSSKHSGLASHCKDCRNEVKREYRASALGVGVIRVERRRYYVTHPDQAQARSVVGRAIRRGKLVRGPCNACSSPGKTEAHHWSYLPSHWLDVEWLCRACHVEHHRAERAAARILPIPTPPDTTCNEEQTA